MTIQEVLSIKLIKDKAVCRVLGVFIFIIFTSLGAFVRIPLPFSPVPITLQTFFVLLSGLILGGNLGATSQIFYVILGVLGFPIFTNATCGFYYLFGPTGGYLFGFILVSFLIGNVIRKTNSNFGLFSIVILGSMIILFFGSIWLMLLFKIGFDKAILLGALPFIPGDIIKSIFACLVYKKIHSRTKEIF
jgi:biotin transport system substrate-specific component